MPKKKLTEQERKVKDLETAINALESIQECMNSEEVPADDFIQSWVRSNPDFPNAERYVRAVYAEAIGYAISVLKKNL